MFKKTWFTANTSLPEINFSGDADTRFPDFIAAESIAAHSHPNDLILDPFCGFGTTLRVAQSLGRRAIGFEIEKSIADYAKTTVSDPHSVINDDVLNIGRYQVSDVALIITSPPFGRLIDGRRLVDDTYFADICQRLLTSVQRLRFDGKLIVEAVNLKQQANTIPLAFDLALRLSQVLKFEGEHVICSSDDTQIHGNNHTYLLKFARH